jgi:hypothetical protein
MSEPTVKDLLYCRLKHEVTFAEFYGGGGGTKNAKPFLRKVHNIEKFELMKRKPRNQ